MSTNWKTIIERAAEVSGARAVELMVPVVELLEYASVQDATPEIQAMVRTVLDDELGEALFITSVKQTTGTETSAEFVNARRVTLFHLPGILLDLRATLFERGVPARQTMAGLEAMCAAYETLEAEEAAARARFEEGNPVCPRCKSVRVLTQYCDLNGVRVYETRCKACRMYTSWPETESTTHPWNP